MYIWIYIFLFQRRRVFKLVDNKLWFSVQCNKLCTILRYVLGIICNITNFIHKKHISVIYKTFILPHIEYACICYLYINSSFFQKISRINAKILAYTDLDTQYYSLQYRLHRSMVFFFIKLYECKIDSIRFDFFMQQHNTRRNINLPLINKRLYLYSYKIWCVKLLSLLLSKNIPKSSIIFTNRFQLLEYSQRFFDKLFNHWHCIIITWHTYMTYYFLHFSWYHDHAYVILLLFLFFISCIAFI